MRAGFWGTTVTAVMQRTPTGASACRMPVIGFAGVRSSSLIDLTQRAVRQCKQLTRFGVLRSEQAGIRNAFVTIPGGKHGGFSDTEMAKAYAEIRGFLDKQNIVRQTTN